MYFFINYTKAFNCVLLLLLSRFSRVRPCVTPETAAHQAPPSMGFSRQEYWSGVPWPSPFNCVDRNKLWKVLKRWEYQTTLPVS